MQFDVVSRLVPGFIVSAQSLGVGRLILLVYEWEAPWPRKFGIYLIEDYRVMGSVKEQSWDEVDGFVSAAYRDSGGGNDTWWKLISGRVRERVGGSAR